MRVAWHGNHTVDTLMIVLSWSMQIRFVVPFPTEIHDGPRVDKFRTTVSNLPLHCTAVLLQARGDWQIYNVLFACPLGTHCNFLVAQGQPGWEELIAQALTIFTMEDNYILGW